MKNMSQDTAEAGPIGLIAGGGLLPLEFARHAPQLGIGEIIAVGFKDYTAPELVPLVAQYQDIAIGQLGRLIKFFKTHQVSRALMLGSLSPRLTIANVRLDMRMIMLAAKVKDRRADSVLGAIANEMARDGIILQPTTEYLPHLLVRRGVLTKKQPGKKDWDDIRMGIRLARASGGLDIGQTVVTKKQAVVAVEAMEGTDACIQRAGTLAKKVIIVKMAKPRQDLRFDVPCIGPDTLRTMSAAGASILAVEADKTFIIDRQAAIELADTNGICIIGVTPEEGEQEI